MSASSTPTPTAPPVRLRPAVRLLLLRSAPSGLEVLLARRPDGLRFDGGTWALPGGRIGEDEPPAEGGVRLAEAELGLRLAPDRLLPSGGYRTPPFGPVRRDVQLLAASPPTQPPAPLGERLERLAWLAPGELLRRWAAGAEQVPTPLREVLSALAALAPAEASWPEAAAAAVARACPAGRDAPEVHDLVPGLRVFPVRTPTLPPATHTNCYVVGAGRELLVVDPAAPYPEERARLDAFLDGLAARGQRVREVLLTHHHHDHVSGAEHLARRLDVSIAAHLRTRERLAGKVPVDRLVADGEVWELPGDPPRRLRAHLLEGHADGHLVFHEEVSGGAIAGDMVAGTGTILVAPPEGDMTRYLESLRRLEALGPSVLYPAHGPPITDPPGLLDFYVEHRLMRERKVVRALAEGEGPVLALVPRVYDDVPEKLYPLAARSLLAHLLKLEGEARAERTGEVWRLTC